MKNVLLSCFFLVFSFALSAQAKTENLRIYPNPVTSTFEIGESERVANIKVINMVGREVRDFDFIEGGKYDIADLPQGMYLVQLRDADEKVIHTQRVKKN